MAARGWQRKTEGFLFWQAEARHAPEYKAARRTPRGDGAARRRNQGSRRLSTANHKELANKEPLRGEAVQMLAILEDTLRILEQHCGLIRSWLKEGQVTTLFVSRAQRERW